mgnify:FL=1|tara:strand:- start:3249 stop:4340 length:1092 start_codon:yes stop_codon:yes gene_type:complete
MSNTKIKEKGGLLADGTLQFCNKSAEINLEDLRKSCDFSDANGKFPKSRPKNSWEILADILISCKNINTFDSSGYNPGRILNFRNITGKDEDIKVPQMSISQMFINENGCRRINQTGTEEDNHIKNYLIEKIAATISIEHIRSGRHHNQMRLGGNIHEKELENITITETDKKRIMAVDKYCKHSIGISIQEKGITLAYGLNVNVCSNMLVFGSNILKTFGRNKTSYEEMINTIYKKFNESFIWNNMKYKYLSLADSNLTEKGVKLLTGELMSFAEEAITSKNRNLAVLNVSQILNVLRKSRTVTYASNPDSGETLSVWDFVQWTTDALKPEYNDLTSIWDVHAKFTDYVYNQIKEDNTKYSIT